MRKVQIYVDNQLIDLFDDESIKVNSSVQNINDISKVFTDFTQSFTVPASPKNNDIFGYYYNNDNNTFDANTRVPARIEIDFTPFRKGKIQLQSAVVKNNQVEAYKINFYGDVVTLKDLFGDDKLKDLDYSSIDFEYSGQAVQDSITDTSYQDIRFPLISSSRVWTYNDGSGIDLSAYAIYYPELFPAVSDSKIMELIQETYGVTFEGNFLDDDRFKKSYTWWKNRETPEITTKGVDVPFNLGDVACDPNLPSDIVGVSEINMQYIDMNSYATPPAWDSWINPQYHQVDLYVYNTSTTNTYYIDVYKNGVFNNTFSGSGTGLISGVAYSQNWFGLNDNYTFKVRATGAMSLEIDVKYRFYGYYNSILPLTPVLFFEDGCQYPTGVINITAEIDLVTTAPDISVLNWFNGTLSEFNLTCVPIENELTYIIEPLVDYYKNGDKVDITEHVNTDSITYERAKLYNEISFEWETSKSFLNTRFAGFNNRQYGNLSEVFPEHDGGKYTIKLPFETMLFNNFDDINGNLQVGYCLTDAPDYKPYIPKPVKLYLSDSLTCQFYFDNGNTVDNILSYMPFGQEVEHNTQTYTMNFGEEISSLDLSVLPNSLYQTYYQPYLLNLFDSKTRKVTLECVLPLDMLIGLSLDDSIIVRDKRYIIDSMSTDLTTGLVKFVLLSSWVSEEVFTYLYEVPAAGGTVFHPIKPPKNGGWIDIDAPLEPQFITSNPTLPATNVNTSTNWLITVPINNTGLDRTQTINYRGYNSDGSLAWSAVLVIFQLGADGYLLKEDGGYLLQENLDRLIL